MTRLLDTERQYKARTRRTGIYEELKRWFDTSSRSKDEAIDNAHYQRNLKDAFSEGDVEKVREMMDDEGEPKPHLSWGNVKFGGKLGDGGTGEGS